MATATIVGGANVRLSLDPREARLAQKALGQAGAGYTVGQVLTSLNDPPTSGDFNVYVISGDQDWDHGYGGGYGPQNGGWGWDGGGRGDGGFDRHGDGGGGDGHGGHYGGFGEAQSLVLPTGGQVLIVDGDRDYRITGHTGQELLMGNRGNDSINAAGGNGTIISGPGRDQIQLNSEGLAGGSMDIVTGRSAKIEMWGGSATISGTGRDSVDVGGGDNTISDGNSKPLDVNIRGAASNNDIRVNGNSFIEIHAAGNDTILTGNHGETVIEFDHKGGVNAMIGGHHQDKVIIESGDNTITAAPGMHFGVTGGDNVVTVFGGANVTLRGGVNDFTAGGTGSEFALRGGSDTVTVWQGADDTISSGSGHGHDRSPWGGGGGGGAVVLTGHDTVKLIGGGFNVTENGPGDVLNLSHGGSDTVTGDGTINIEDHGKYTIVVNGNDTINYGSGKDTVVHGAATVYGSCGGVTVAGGMAKHVTSMGSGSATLIGGSPSHPLASATGSAALSAVLGVVHAPTVMGGTTLFTFTGEKGGAALGADHFHNGSVQVSMVSYEPVTQAKTVGAISMDQGHTRIVLDGLSHSGAAFNH